MKKIGELTQKQFDEIQNSNNKTKTIKNILGIDKNKEINIGDTCFKVENSKPLDVFENTFNGHKTTYIVIETLNKDLALAYTVY